jgi:hypothetical protein
MQMVAFSVTSFSFLDLQLGTDLIAALAAAAAAILIMAFTLSKVASSSSGTAVSGGGIPSQVNVSDSNGGFLRVAFSLLLVGCCVGLIILGIGAWTGFASTSDIWEVLKTAALAEALALSYYHVMRNKQ